MNDEEERRAKEWDRENKRAAQEKHDEKYWVEIETGVAKPRFRPLNEAKPVLDDIAKKKIEELRVTISQIEALYEKWKKDGRI